MLFSITGAAAGLRRHLVSQFQRPRGILGRLAGVVLAHRPSNRERNRWTVGLLDIQPKDRVLELGFGPGLSIEQASRLAVDGEVVGIDHSDVMVATASRRNRAAIDRGRVRLVRGSFSDPDRLPVPGSFDAIFGVNALHFTADAERVLRAWIERLRPGGSLAITFQSRRPGATDADSHEAGEQLAAQMRAVGLEDVRIEVLPLEPVCAVCVLGKRAGRPASCSSVHVRSR
jgi:SAM-dependent methyltransferase